MENFESKKRFLDIFFKQRSFCHTQPILLDKMILFEMSGCKDIGIKKFKIFGENSVILFNTKIRDNMILKRPNSLPNNTVKFSVTKTQ